MTTSARARAGRRIGRIAAVGAVALILAGTAAAPAEARTRRQAVYLANSAIGACFELGGDPWVDEGGGGFSFICTWEDGNYYEQDIGYN